MRIYFERFIYCEKCGENQRQTTMNLPLNWIGKYLDREHRRQFKEEHILCNSEIRYSSWKSNSRYLDIINNLYK